MVIHCTDVVKKHLPVIHFSWNYIAIGSSLKSEASRWQHVNENSTLFNIFFSSVSVFDTHYMKIPQCICVHSSACKQAHLSSVSSTTCMHYVSKFVFQRWSYMRLWLSLNMIWNGSSRNSEVTLFKEFTKVNNWWMENTVFGDVFVVFCGFCDNGDGM